MRKYLPEVMPGVARAKMRAGGTRAELARLFRVRLRTLRCWEARYPAFRKALRTPCEITIAEVEACLAQAAMGGTYSETTITIVGAVETRKINYQYAPPSLSAIKLWLKYFAPQPGSDGVPAVAEKHAFIPPAPEPRPAPPMPEPQPAPPDIPLDGSYRFTHAFRRAGMEA